MTEYRCCASEWLWVHGVCIGALRGFGCCMVVDVGCCVVVHVGECGLVCVVDGV